MESPKERVGPAKLLYLYCIYKGDPCLSPGPGIDGSSPTFALCHRGVCGLVSHVPLDEFGQETLDERAENPEWLIPKATRHEEIVRSVMELYPVIPVKFGNMYASDEAALQFLRNGYKPFCSFLDFVQDKQEWGVKVYANQDLVRSPAAASSQRVYRFDRGPSSAAAGRAYLQRKKREGLAQQEAIHLLGRLADEIYQHILSWSVEGRRNKPLSKQATAKEQDMILNTAFLVRKSKVPSFKDRIDALAVSHKASGLSFEMSGPWPPYNFCPEIAAHTGGAKA